MAGLSFGLGMGLGSPRGSTGEPAPDPIYNYYVASTGNDSNDGSAGSPFATLLKLASVMQTGANDSTTTAFIASGTYSDDQFLPNTLTRENVRMLLFFEEGCTLSGGATTQAGNDSAFDSGGIGSEIIIYGAGLRITGYTTGTGNGLGASGQGKIYAYDCNVDNCIDGFSVHADSYGEAYRCNFSQCIKSCVAHVNNSSSYHEDCVFTGHDSISMTAGLVSVNTPFAHEFVRCKWVPTAVNRKGLTNANSNGPTLNILLRECELGTLSEYINITSSDYSGIVVEDSFVNISGTDGHNMFTLRRCYGFISIRKRGTTEGIVIENSILGGADPDATQDSLMWRASNLGASPFTVVNSIITGYTTAIGAAFDAANAAGQIDAPTEISYCCLFGNTTNFHSTWTADDGFAAAVHDNITSDPLIGDMSSTNKADWGYGPGSPCIGAGSSGGNIGFAASE